MTYKISALFIYPVKGLGGINVDSSFAQKIGFQHDRNYMLIDDGKKFITQRQMAKLAKFNTFITDEHLIVKYKCEEVFIPLRQNTKEELLTQVFDDTARTYAVDHNVDAWFSQHLKQKVRLVKLADNEARHHISSQTLQKYAVSLADGYPYLLVGQSSLDYLNQKLEDPVCINRFRPNIVVSTINPHEEDDWKSFSIGDAHFQNIKPCGRCQVISIDQETANTGFEPIKTLSQYRKKGNSINFGTNLVCTQPGWVHVGDTINLNID